MIYLGNLEKLLLTVLNTATTGMTATRQGQTFRFRTKMMARGSSILNLRSNSAPLLNFALREAAMPLNAIRLLLALFVLYSHAFPLGGFGGDPKWLGVSDGTSFGSFAVGGFFALSGLFVTQSAITRPLHEFVIARLLRILPALLAVLVISAFLLGPIVYSSTNGGISGYWNWGSTGPFNYVLHNIFLPTGLQYGIENIFASTTPYGVLKGFSIVNGSLWTLPIEIRCYLVAALIGVFGRVFGYFRVSALLLVASLVLHFLSKTRPDFTASILPEYFPSSFLELLSVFLIGALIGSVSHKIRLTHIVGLVGAGSYGISMLLGGQVFAIFGIGSLAILIPYFCYQIRNLPLGIFKVDASYGTYLWAFPVQQTLAFLHLNSNFMMFLLLSVFFTVVAAILSWFLIEKSSLSLKNKWVKQAASTEVGV